MNKALMTCETMSNSPSYFNWTLTGKKRKWAKIFKKKIIIKNIPNLDKNLFLLILEVPSRENTRAHACSLSLC